MRTYPKHRLRTRLDLESLEGRTLLSTGLVDHHAGQHMPALPMVAQATTAFSGTLTGSYSNVNAVGFAQIRSYATSGTLSGVGSARLRGTLFFRSSAPAGHAVGQFVIHNIGGSMILKVFKSATPGTYSDVVVRTRGSDTAYQGASGTLMMTQAQNFSVPFYTSGHVTMTFASA